MDFEKTFAATLKKHMARRNLSAYRLAKLAGLNPSSVQRIINGERSPTLDTMGKLMKELGLSFTVVSLKA